MAGHRRTEAEMLNALPEPLDVIRLSLRSPQTARTRFAGYRLARLVGSRLELDEEDVALLPVVLATDVFLPASDGSRPFDVQLRATIRNYDLEALFSDDGPASYHHAIRPTGYDHHHGEVIPLGMERWRADYRAMSEERQMIAATIIWLYRAGKDNVWLRRVPCTWHATDAIAHMKEKNALADWVRLFALYPGW